MSIQVEGEFSQNIKQALIGYSQIEGGEPSSLSLSLPSASNNQGTLTRSGSSGSSQYVVKHHVHYPRS